MDSQRAEAWVAERRAFFSRKWKPLAVSCLAMLLAATLIKHNVRIGWDGQQRSCLPWTLYFYTPVDDVAQPFRGQLVRVNLPKSGHERLPTVLRERFQKGAAGGGAKLVVGMPGDLIRIKNNWLVVNEDPWGFMWLMPGLNYKDKELDQEYRIPTGHYLVLGTQPESYDGRYWGLVKEADILGSVRVIL